MSARVLKGKVKTISGDKTVKVEVMSLVKHPIYKKILKRSVCLLCHNEVEGVEVGSNVEIKECKPYSKRKSWVVVMISNK